MNLLSCLRLPLSVPVASFSLFVRTDCSEAKARVSECLCTSIIAIFPPYLSTLPCSTAAAATNHHHLTYDNRDIILGQGMKGPLKVGPKKKSLV